MIKTILLDLDGTLSTMDTKYFTKSYLLALGRKINHLIPVDKFLAQVMASTEVMVRNNDPTQTNMNIFLDDFSLATGLSKDALWPIFIDFYSNEFSKFGGLVTPRAESKELVETAVAKGYTVAVACNPLMPKVAILERIKWTGVNLTDLAFVPSIEEMHFCKPNPKYFAEIAKFLGKHPEECLMVGNEPQEDMVAGEVGIKTYLITDKYKEDVVCNFQGDLANLLTLIRNNELIC